MSRTWVGQKRLNGPWENHYIVVKMSPDSPWQLQKAWRTDTEGNTVEEYRINISETDRDGVLESPNEREKAPVIK